LVTLTSRERLNGQRTAGWAGAALLAGEGHEHLVGAVGAAHAGEAFAQITALEVGLDGVADDGAPEAVLGREALVVDALELVEVSGGDAPEAGGLRVAGAVERSGLEQRGAHSGASRKAIRDTSSSTISVNMLET